MTDNVSKAATLVIDPVCGMDVNPATSKHQVDHAGKSYFFCCAGCAEKFKSNPEKYLNPATRPSSDLVTLGGTALRPSNAGASANQPAYVCPMCPQVRASKPRTLSQVRNGARIRGSPKCHAHRIHVPHASGNRPPRPRIMPHLRHGTRTAHRLFCRRRQSRTA